MFAAVMQRDSRRISENARGVSKSVDLSTYLAMVVVQSRSAKASQHRVL